MGHLVGMDGRPIVSADEELRLKTIAMNAWAAREAARMFGECALRACLSKDPPHFVLYQMSGAGVPMGELGLVMIREFLEKLHEAYWPGTLAACTPPPNIPPLPDPKCYVRFEPGASILRRSAAARKTEKPG